MPKTCLLNPALEDNIPLVIALMESVHGLNSGQLRPYEAYSLTDTDGHITEYVLTLSVLQFRGNHLDYPTLRRLDVVEPTAEAQGSFGAVYPVIQSIIFINGQAVFEQDKAFIVKEIVANQSSAADKKDKPNYYVRAARREHYLASQCPSLGVNYELLEENDYSYLHMNRAPGYPLQHYANKLNAREYLTLACALLREVPKQTHQRVRHGKRQDSTIVHCDLKENNIMAQYQDGQWLITVIDFGLAKTMTDNQYKTLKKRGNFGAWDSHMLFAWQHRQELHYTKETDAYALFTLILKLGGLTRTCDTVQSLQLALAKGELCGLFEPFDFPAQLKTHLMTLSQAMMTCEREKRISVAQALQGFEAILKNLPYSPPRPIESSLEPITKAADLLEHLRADLDTEQYSLSLNTWLKRYRTLLKTIAATEYEQTQTNPTLISSPSIYLIHHYSLINEYNDDSIIRLMLRHQSLIEPIIAEHPLPARWVKRFDTLHYSLSLQLSMDDELLWQEVGDYKQHISKLLLISDEFKNEPPLLLVHLVEESNNQLNMDFDHWKTELPLLAKPFNRKARVLFQLCDLVSQYQPLTVLNPAWELQFELWGRTVTTRIIEDIDNQQVNEELGVRKQLALLLHHYNEIDVQIVLARMPIVMPALKGSNYVLDVIGQAIQSLDLEQQQQVEALYLRLSTCMALKELYLCIDSEDGYLTETVELKLYCTKKLVHLINNLNAFDFHKQCDELSMYFFALNGLFDFIRYLDCHIQTIHAVEILMLHPALAIQLNELTSTRSATDDLSLLDFNLGQMLEKSSEHNILLAEFVRYYSDPKQYTPLQQKTAPPYSMRFLTTISERPQLESDNELLFEFTL